MLRCCVAGETNQGYVNDGRRRSVQSTVAAQSVVMRPQASASAVAITSDNDRMSEFSQRTGRSKQSAAAAAAYLATSGPHYQL